MGRRAMLCVALCCLAAAVGAADDCSDLNGCSGHGQCRQGVCVCHAGFGFKDCSMRTDNCPNHCFGHGSCLDGSCECDQGFGGADCGVSSAACPNNCTGHGICADGRCVCFAGLWTGEACETEVYKCPESLNHCTGHGTCQPTDPDNAASEWACVCEAGFCGPKCDQVCGSCPSNCSGHGMCVQGSECVCHAGFRGDDCSLADAVHTCPNNCSGHGLCQQVNGSTEMRCACSGCFSGPDCSQSSVFCPGDCSGHGVCDCSGKCHCQSGFTGVACQEAELSCAALQHCSANGQCVKGKCVCAPGFGGTMCELACHTGGSSVGCNAHLKRGRCVANVNGTAAHCVCKPEFTGDGCEIEAVESMAAELISGSSPIGTIVAAVVGVVAVVFVGLFARNYAHGKRGVNAIPGVDGMRSKVNEGDYEAIADSRNQSNY